MSVRVNRFSAKGEALKKASEALKELLADYKNQPVLLLLSGGSAFSLPEGIDTNLLGKHITISVLDERYSTDPKVNNFLQLQSLPFYKKAKQAGCNFILTSFLADLSLKIASESFGNELRNWKTKNPEGKTIITQGMGEDGHTSGIMPFPEDKELFRRLFVGERWVVGYNAEDKNPYPLRVSTTITFLKDWVDNSIFYVSGESKKKVFQKLLKGDEHINNMPAQVIWEMKDVRVFTDLTR